MPVQYETIPVPLVRGLDEKSDAKFAQPPSLLEAKNVEVTKNGKVQKRRGFLRIDSNDEIVNNGNKERVFHHICTYQDELVLFGYNFLYAIVSKTAGVVTSKSTVLRGVMPRSTVRFQDVTGSGGGEKSEIPG